MLRIQLVKFKPKPSYLKSPTFFKPRLIPALRFISTSHVTGSTSEPLYNQTTGRFILDLADRYGSKTAVVSVHQQTNLSFQSLHDLSSILAVNLIRQFGLKRGDRVAVCAGNRWEYPVLQMGLGKAGLVLVPLNPAFTDAQFHAALNSSGAKVLMIQEKLSRGPNKPARETKGLVKAAQSGSFPELESIVFLESGQSGSDSNLISGSKSDPKSDPSNTPLLSQFSPLVNWTSSDSPHSAPELSHIFDASLDSSFSHETINMQFTSGTTALPKISCLSHFNLLNNGIFIGSRLGLTATESSHPSKQDHICAPVPMFHCFGLVLANLAAWAHGAAIVYPSESYDARKAMQAVRQHHCTGLHGVPTMFSASLELHDELSKGGHELLQKGICAGAAVPIELMKHIFETLNLRDLTICYGMTETSPVSFMSTPDDAIHLRCETVGKVMPHTEAMIIRNQPEGKSALDALGEPLDMTPLPLDTKGEIVISGYLLQKQYHNAPDKTAEAMVYDPATNKTWMRTGDEGTLDKDGYLRVTGRLKDLIIRGGENIHPLEIENVLFGHPAVAQASVVGVSDEKYGEAVAAFIVLHEGEGSDGEGGVSTEEIQGWVKERLGHYMVPKYVFFVNGFPKTASGKIRKVDLRSTAEELIKGKK